MQNIRQVGQGLNGFCLDDFGLVGRDFHALHAHRIANAEVVKLVIIDATVRCNLMVAPDAIFVQFLPSSHIPRLCIAVEEDQHFAIASDAALLQECG